MRCDAASTVMGVGVGFLQKRIYNKLWAKCSGWCKLCLCVCIFLYVFREDFSVVVVVAFVRFRL